MDRGQSLREIKREEEESTEGASTSSFISPEAAVVGSGQYDVFLSFRGSDTRKGFTDYLYHSLVKAGTVPFCVFRDDINIPIGEEFGSQIFDAIARSKISIPVISENYASSKWCLRELIRIMDRKKSTSHIVLPIFYKVAPSEVRHLTGNFGNAFRSSKERFDEKDIREGQCALNEVSYLHGWESEKIANGHEGELIERVVKTVVSKLQEDFQLDVPKQLVGLDGRLKEIMDWIDSPSINARMIGIYGMGGIGKTTLAKCIYNQLSDKFVHVSFLPDVRETIKRHGITHLQSQLVSDILKGKNEVSRVDDGINIIKSRFQGKKVLILLDDIDDKNQLDALAGERNWFTAGSMIIVTTRNKAVLDQSEFEVDYRYELGELDGENALLLFNRHAFRMDHSPWDFMDISHYIISTMGGLPLALKVVGSYLYKKTNRNVWEDVLKQLQSQPHKDVQKMLGISYDALEDDQKQIFLDIACSLIGKESKFAMYMWEDRGFYPNQGIEELKLRCLIKIGDHGEFEMHDQLRDLGISIFRQGHLLGKRSRPWDRDYGGVSRVLNDQSFFLFKDLMRKASSGDINALLSEVGWLQCSVFGIDSSLWPTNLHLPELAVLDLTNTGSREDWEGWSSIMMAAEKRLQVLDLGVCIYLRCMPDLSAFTQLKILILSNCWQMGFLHPSIGQLKSLVSLNLSSCYSLNELPEEVGELKDLEELLLDYASAISKIPTSIGSLRKLETLSACFCDSLREIPSSIADLQNLQRLDLSGSAIEKLPSAIGRLTNLRTLLLQSCNSLKGAIPSEIGDLSSLEILDMAFAPIPDLPESIRNLSSLQRLSLLGCNNLRSLPELPSGLTHLLVSCQSPRLPQLSSLIHLEELHLQACNLLQYIPELSQLNRLKRLRVQHCNYLVEIEGHDYLEFLEGIFIDDCNSIKRLLCPRSRCLKQLVAVRCSNLVEIQGLDGAKFLEKLDFTGCKSMEALPDLTGCEKLRSLVVKDCKKLAQLRGLEKLDLVDLDISGCDSMETLPK
ncbi:disease resistance protein RPV1-like isoform X1 [Syzygium oleosum]|uniref:disease resistance protein RPV1-like isoform X1 n=2 Tax=Syzygium oleosum TaxID=219896 RepID=UPI0024BA9567|nr:disease resistance protein RPV1-like isoform X1 [Syzygium oleosum]XP_056161440.1 disease resistance protein RPV1-like isoform X1 [Syzygium oleosum]XP_056161441.1 disease resistance protein RPV1-like isoform X1 [Syzygium oleosum]XP_056161442.1 disease resistance protein RPV1-like isoform X1 [Syzygium oleosum]XP_056161443.1 disease resistance protein RPV1-like isoform X1 [Syzygium oleosum]XP_056161444.1 disease resistance protein RPV1-like isoform X1 [Syzygium oleosum]XP_056161445.1 disease 